MSTSNVVWIGNGGASQYPLSRSVDGGTTFTVMTGNNLPEWSAPAELAQSSDGSKVIVKINSYIYYSTNYGFTFTQGTYNDFFDIQFAKGYMESSDVVYALLKGSYQLYKSTDGGANWSLFQSFSTQPYCLDNRNGVLAVGCEVDQAGNGGLYVYNGSWSTSTSATRMNDGSNDRAVVGVALDDDNRVLAYVDNNSYNSGVYYASIFDLSTFTEVGTFNSSGLYGSMSNYSKLMQIGYGGAPSQIFMVYNNSIWKGQYTGFSDLGKWISTECHMKSGYSNLYPNYFMFTVPSMSADITSNDGSSWISPSFPVSTPNTSSEISYHSYRTQLIYDGNGAEMGSVPVDSNVYNTDSDYATVVGNTGSLTKNGYIFVGWNTRADGNGITFQASDSVSDMTFSPYPWILYAKWAVAWTMSFDGNGSDGGTVPDSEVVQTGGNYTLPGNTGSLTKSGFNFVGWSTSPSSPPPQYYPNDTYYSVGSNLTFYAIWESASFTVTYDGNGSDGGTVPTDPNSYVTGNYAVIKSPGTMSRTWYSFSHWNTAANGSGDSYYYLGLDLYVTGNTTLYAQWTPNAQQPTPTFDPVAGIYNASQNVTISSANADAIYYTTDGNTPTTGSTLYSGPVSVAASLTLKALAVRSNYPDSAIGSAAYVIDTQAPTCVVATTEPSPTSNLTFPVTFEFSEDVTGFTVEDITVTNGSAGNFAGTGASYSADITADDNGLTVGVQVLSSKCVDIANNANAVSNLVEVEISPIALISRTTAVTGTLHADVDVTVATLLAIEPLASDVYYSAVSNIKKILFTYKNLTQTKVIKFLNNGSDVFPTSSVYFSEHAHVGTWVLKQITIRDFDGGCFHVNAADIPAGYDIVVSNP